MLATWLSYDDLERLVVASLTAPVVGHSVIYGCSDNSTRWWDNTSAAHSTLCDLRLYGVPPITRGEVGPGLPPAGSSVIPTLW